jgi:dimethylamine monooxygenase subunit A
MKQRIHIPSPSSSSRMTMGIQGLSLEDWIEIDENFAIYLNRKKQLLEYKYLEVFASLPGSQPAQTEVLKLLLEHLSIHFSQYYHQQGTQIKNLATNEVWYIEDFENNPLDLAGRLVQEDLCIMQYESGKYLLSAASLCFPHHWRLREKLGKPVSQIHDPVPGYSENLEHPVDGFFNRLQSESPVYRLNWGIADTSELFYPSSESHNSAAPDVTIENIGEKLWLRIERQTLRRLEESRDILFTIRTYIYPLSILASNPIAARNLEGVIKQTSPEMQAYKNVLPFRDTLFRYLTAIGST